MQGAESPYFVSCVGQKRKIACQAQDLYISDWFLKARRYAQIMADKWFILSAEYGLVAPDQIILPYEKALNSMAAHERRKWSQKVTEQLGVFSNVREIVFLAGIRYREGLEPHLALRGISVLVPMKGMRIGEQKSWLKQKLVNATSHVPQH